MTSRPDNPLYVAPQVVLTHTLVGQFSCTTSDRDLNLGRTLVRINGGGLPALTSDNPPASCQGVMQGTLVGQRDCLTERWVWNLGDIPPPLVS
jgi:hypothetical protein